MLFFDISTPANFLNLTSPCEDLRASKEGKKNVACVLSTASEETHGPVHTCRAGLSLGWIGNLCSLSLSLSFSLFLSLSLSLSVTHTHTHTHKHSLSFLKDIVQSVTLERYLFLPFLAGFRDPSSEKLMWPVQFPVSSPLSRLNCCALVRKSISLFGIYCPCSAHTHTHECINCTSSCSLIYMNTVKGAPAFTLQKKKSKYDTKHGSK